MREAFTVLMRGVAIVLAGVSAIAQATTVPPPMRTQWDGVYTSEQAKRGERVFVEHCARCHGAELTGGQKGPALTGAEFDVNWNELALSELLNRIEMTMPEDDRGILTRQQAADLVAFMLSKGRAPAGTLELPTDDNQLRVIRYSAEKPPRRG